MLRKTVVPVIAVLIMLNAPLQAEQPDGQPETAKKPDRICKSFKVTGSNLRKTRICMTQREWAAEEEGARRTMEAARPAIGQGNR